MKEQLRGALLSPSLFDVGPSCQEFVLSVQTQGEEDLTARSMKAVIINMSPRTFRSVFGLLPF